MNSLFAVLKVEKQQLTGEVVNYYRGQGGYVIIYVGLFVC